MTGSPDEPAGSTSGLDRRAAMVAVGTATTGALLAGPAIALDRTPQRMANYTWMSAGLIRDSIVGGKVSAAEIADHFLGRIAKLDPQLHAFRDVDADGARAQARALDASRADGTVPGPLFGVPVAIKEHINVKGLKGVFADGHGLQQTGATIIGEEDAICVERLRAAGAVIVGTTVMPGMGIGVGMPDLTNHPRNPWNPARVPGSSSAGSATAVASAMVPLALGSDGGGSTRLPSALCGVIGIHPTAGRVPDVDYHKQYFRLLTGSFGPIARDIHDVAITMKAIAGPDGRDMLSTQHGPPPDYVNAIDRPVVDMRLGWTPDFGFAGQFFNDETPAIVALAHQAALQMSQVGARVESSDIKAESFWPHVTTTLAFYDLQDQPNDAIRAALKVRQYNRALFDAELEKYDFLLSPTAPFTAPTVEQWNESWKSLSFAPRYTATTFMFNWLMLPAISVPIGFHQGMPVGLQIVGKPDSEPRMLQLARAFMERFPQPNRPGVS